MSSYIPLRIRSNLLDQIELYMNTHNIKDRSKAIRNLIEIGLSIGNRTSYNGGSFSDITSRKLCDFPECTEPAQFKLFHKGQTILACKLHKNRNPFKQFGYREI